MPSSNADGSWSMAARSVLAPARDSWSSTLIGTGSPARTRARAATRTTAACLRYRLIASAPRRQSTSACSIMSPSSVSHGRFTSPWCSMARSIMRRYSSRGHLGSRTRRSISAPMAAVRAPFEWFNSHESTPIGLYVFRSAPVRRAKRMAHSAAPGTAIPMAPMPRTTGRLRRWPIRTDPRDLSPCPHSGHMGASAGWPARSNRQCRHTG